MVVSCVVESVLDGQGYSTGLMHLHPVARPRSMSAPDSPIQPYGCIIRTPIERYIDSRQELNMHADVELWESWGGHTLSPWYVSAWARPSLESPREMA